MKISRSTLIMVAASVTALSMSGQEATTLREKFKDHFFIGTAFGRHLHWEQGQPTLKLIDRHFNTISPTNELKWQPFQPKPDVYNHGPADAFVDFGKKNTMYVVGHVLFWHSQTPEWVFQDDDGNPLSREALLQRMRERVHFVAERYGSRINAWDVVNESIMGNGELRDSQWTRIIGDDFIEQAFRIADEELPKAVELIYNDYSMTGKRKRDGVVKLTVELKRKGLRIDGVGMQGHWSVNGPSIRDIEASIVAFSEAGVDVHITELDIDVLPRHPKMWSGNADTKLNLQQDPRLNPYRNGLPDAIQKKLAARYASIFGLLIKHSDKIKRVTFWGPTDKHSWLNGWPIKGRTNYPLLFDREGQTKPAFHAVMQLPTNSNSQKKDNSK